VNAKELKEKKEEMTGTRKKNTGSQWVRYTSKKGSKAAKVGMRGPGGKKSHFVDGWGNGLVSSLMVKKTWGFVGWVMFEQGKIQAPAGKGGEPIRDFQGGPERKEAW